MTYYSTPYITSQGKRWYDIAWAFYGNPSMTAPLVEANPRYADRLIFESGLQLRIPILAVQPPSTLPPWKRGVTTS